MAGEIEVFSLIKVLSDGVHKVYGSLVESVKGVAASFTAKNIIPGQLVTIPASSQVTPWIWADTSGFAFLQVKIIGGAGFVQVGLRYNAPTSSTDLTPTGSINHWKDLGLNCVGVFQRDTERAYIHATAANEVAQSGSGTYPGVWAEGAKVNGVADALAIRNEGTSAVTVELIVIPK